eukprot:2146958-Amphidinium_carterae.1
MEELKKIQQTTKVPNSSQSRVKLALALIGARHALELPCEGMTHPRTPPPLALISTIATSSKDKLVKLSTNLASSCMCWPSGVNGACKYSLLCRWLQSQCAGTIETRSVRACAQYHIVGNCVFIHFSHIQIGSWCIASQLKAVPRSG